jgi:hypothetical protein
MRGAFLCTPATKTGLSFGTFRSPTSLPFAISVPTCDVTTKGACSAAGAPSKEPYQGGRRSKRRWAEPWLALDIACDVNDEDETGRHVVGGRRLGEEAGRLLAGR